MYQARVAGSGRDVSQMIDPIEMRRLRDQVQADKTESQDLPPQ